MAFLSALTLTTIFFSFSANAALYSYVDEKGTKHIVSSQDEIPEKYRTASKQIGTSTPAPIKPMAYGGSETTSPSVLIATVQWTKPSTGPVTITLVDPSGKTINEADFPANNISIFSTLTTAYQKAVGIRNPSKTEGWTIRVNNASALGTIKTSFVVPKPTPRFKSISVTKLNQDRSLTVQYDIGDFSGGANRFIVMADKTGKTFNGVILGEAKVEANGVSTITVQTESLSDGKWFIFGMLSSDAPPQQIYSRSAVVVQGADISLVAVP